jgi:hypothetical protein
MIALPQSPARSQGGIGTSGPDRFGPATSIGRAPRSRLYLVGALALLFGGCTTPAAPHPP